MTGLRVILPYILSILFVFNVSMGSESDDSIVRPFIATNNWQVISEGQAVPRGLHVRINLQTGLKEAKLLDGTDGAENANQYNSQTDGEQFVASNNPSALLEVPIKTNSDNENAKPEIKFDHSELKLALKKIKNDAKEGTPSVKRTYEQIKKELAEMQHSVKSEYEIVQDLIAEYKATKEDLTKTDILLDLEYYVHQYDNALDFVKMDGFKIVVLPSLNSTNSGLRSAAAFLMGSACQSNQQVQISALEAGSIPLLIRLVAQDPSMQVRSRALYALSSIIRHFPVAQKTFFEGGGVSAFSQLFQIESNDFKKLQLKVVTLLSDIITEKSTLAQYIHEQGDQQSLTGLSAEDALERKNYETKLSQYNSFAAEKVVVEQGFCNLIPRLLTQIKADDDDHDTIEKIVQALLQLSEHCQQDFFPVRPIILHLKSRYWNLSVEEKQVENQESELYFTKLYNMCEKLHSSLHREEL